MDKNFTFDKEQKHEQACAQSDTHTCILTDKALTQLLKALQPKPFRKRHPILFWGFWVLLVCGIVGSFLPEHNMLGENSIAVVRVEDQIGDIAETLEWIREVQKDPSIVGVLLRIDSGGGGVGASQELYAALSDVGKSKPVVASMGGAAASGGLMVALAAEHIVANPSTITGSIGVRMDIPLAQVLMERIGVDKQNIIAGQYKNAGDINKPLTPEERLYFQGVIDDMHNQFVELIAKERNLPIATVNTFADGRILTGRHAKELGLIDALGGQNEALKKLYSITTASPDAPLVEAFTTPEFIKELAEGARTIVHAFQPQRPAFLYQ